MFSLRIPLFFNMALGPLLDDHQYTLFLLVITELCFNTRQVPEIWSIVLWDFLLVFQLPLKVVRMLLLCHADAHVRLKEKTGGLIYLTCLLRRFLVFVTSHDACDFCFWSKLILKYLAIDTTISRTCFAEYGTIVCRLIECDFPGYGICICCRVKVCICL